jgi:RimJ/RimL family protein N-acetyltransferase
MRTLLSPRCTLEPQVVAHAEEMFSVLSDPAIYEYEGVPPPSAERLANGYRRSESRFIRDGTTPFLNWVVRIPNGQLTGYVQATILENGASYVACEFASRFWRQGIGSAAVRTMLVELASSYGVHTFVAALKTMNFRSNGLLTYLGFEPAGADQAALYDYDPIDEVVLLKSAASLEPTSLSPENAA